MPGPGGVVVKVKSKRDKCFVVFVSQPCKTPSESKNKEENKRAGSNTSALLESLTGRLMAFGESDVRARHFQGGLDRRPGVRVGRRVIFD